MPLFARAGETAVLPKDDDIVNEAFAWSAAEAAKPLSMPSSKIASWCPSYTVPSKLPEARASKSILGLGALLGGAVELLMI